MVVLSLEKNIELYSASLFEALLKVSDNRLDEEIAQTVANRYASNLDYSDPELMHTGVTSVAKNLVSKIKTAYFRS